MGEATEWLLFTGLDVPLSLNDRLHWAAKARATKSIRTCVALDAKAQKVGSHDHVHVQLEWTPRVNRTRDVDNPAPTLKAAVDGIVSAGVIPNDDPKHVTHHATVIHPAHAQTGTRVRLRVWVES